MSKLMPTESNPNGQPPAPDVTAAAPDLELTLREFWHKNGKTILLGCGLVLAVIAGKTGYDFIVEKREQGIAADYAAATTPEKLKSFINVQSGHPLAGVAQLRLADEAYSAGKYAEAGSLYQQAAATLKTGPMAARAQLGEGIAKLQLGQTTEGETKLKAVVADANLAKPVRAEAAYHLATLAMDAGRNDDALKQLDQINAIDPTGIWARQAMGLRGRLSIPVTP